MLAVLCGGAHYVILAVVQPSNNFWSNKEISQSYTNGLFE